MFQPLPVQGEATNPLVVVHDEPQPCPYIAGREARMPLQWPLGMMTADMLDQYLSAGFRRSGPFLYRTKCADCQACESTRVDMQSFHWSQSFRRILKRGDRDLQVRIASPTVDPARVAMFNQHRSARQLGLSERELDSQEYTGFLVETICETQELSFWKEDQLVAVATTDFGRDSLSLVYCFFDPQFSRYSLGTYSILKNFELAMQSNRRWVYLGMYVASNSHLNYKARFKPQQRLHQKDWITFE
ncbi:arginyl-tRNA-protein transferase [Rosistilla carotiformis]|uniref:Arginyl-tRNA-protein transferase n=1 Tax=Rosistilla carotiformis TaxID=2528017 RepID=A0A518JYH0_9BACT|nr:arginyltransferase [Rosistilla carotiformis]QDV70583.1 arginyl-tRNA-protein transferase [Rosistilla carotiformis]